MEAVYCFPRPHNKRSHLSSSRLSALCIYVSMVVGQQLRQPVPFQLSRSLVRPSTTPGSCVGSLLGYSCVFQESPHVQQSILYSLGKLGSVRFLAAVEGRDGDVDVLIHGIVTHSVAIWHHRTKAHHAVCLRANLDSPQTDTHTTTNNHLFCNSGLFFLDANIPGWCWDYNAEPQQKMYPWISQA